MNEHQVIKHGALIIYFAIAIIGFTGWIFNILAIVESGPVGTWGGLEILRCVGILLAPLGSILGLFF